MYPDWPNSAADLVPLPQCIGPKLKPFDFQGPQKMEFLEYLGEGRHAFVFKVEILGRIYAIKLFRFDYIEDWIGPADDFDTNDLAALSTVYNYTEPFNCECRSFGRLQEAGHEELAVKCFGYILLDEEHERAMMDKFSSLKLNFDGNVDCPGYEEMRSLFPGKSGRPPPIRGIIKEFGQAAENLKTRDMNRILGNIIQLQQLGIINLDVADRQIINGKLCDFSIALTVPHPTMTPELSPHLPADALPIMEHETFLISINDYWVFDDMVLTWNMEHEDQPKGISARAFPSGRGCRIDYNLRSTPARDRVYTFVDPRRYDWRTATTSPPRPGARRTPEGPRTRQRRTKSRRQTMSKAAVLKTRRRLDKWPPRWFFNCDKQLAAKLKKWNDYSHTIHWHAKGGLIYPKLRQ